MLDLTTKTSAELVELLRTIPVVEWNAAVVYARKKDAYWYASLNGANLYGASLNGALIDGEPITIQQWCDIFDMPTIGKGLRVAFKRLPNDRITGRKYNGGEHLIKWKANRWVEAPDWNDSGECGGGLHLSPTAAMTRNYSSQPLCVAVAFDPKDAVIIGDKLKVRRCKVL